MSARLYATVYEGNDLPTTEAEAVSKSLGTIDEASELECRPMLHGTGSGRIKINRYHTQAALLQQDCYLLVHSDSGIVGGFFLDEGTLALSDEKGKGGEFMELSGQGPMAVLRNANMDATSDITGGRAPVDGYWALDDQGPAAGDSNAHPIPMMKRVLVEMGLNSPNGIAIVDHSSWTYDTDSAGASVPFLDGEAQGAQVGDTGLDLIARMDQLGGVVFVMSPLFKLDAYLSFGTDRSGAFATDTVRFEKGVNIAAAVQRKVRGAVNRTHLIVEGQDRTYVTVVDPDYTVGDIVRWGYLSVPETSNTDQLEAAGLAHIEQRKRQTDAWTFPQHDHGDDPANGIYEPAPDIADGHYWLGDSVALHTGTGSYDADEETVPIAAITFQLKTGSEANGDYWVIPEVGSTFMWSGGDTSFTSNIKPAPPSTLRLCDRAVTGAGVPVVAEVYTGESAGVLSGFTVPAGSGQALIALTMMRDTASRAGFSYDPDSTSGVNAGQDFSLVAAIDDAFGTVGSGNRLEIHALIDPIPTTGTGAIVKGITGGDASASTWTVIRLTGLPVGATIADLLDASESANVANGTAISDAIASASSALILSLLGYKANNTTATPGTGLTLVADKHGFYGPGDPLGASYVAQRAGGSVTNSWALSAAPDEDGVLMLDIAIAGGTAGANPLNGTSNQAARCDKSEHEIMARDPTVDDDQDAGYPRRTIWHNSSSGATFISTDGTAGAAVWADIGGLGESAVQALIDVHTADTSDAHDASAISVLDTAANFTGTDVEAVLAELQDNIDAGVGVTLSDSTPIVESGTGSAGTGTEASRDDHVHPADAGGGGGGLTQTTLGYNTIGGTWFAVTAGRWYLKKITVASAGILANIEAYLRTNNFADATTTRHVAVGLWTDSGGVPDVMLRNVVSGVTFWGASSPAPGRWAGGALNCPVTATDYWIGVQFDNAYFDLAKDGSGSDKQYNPFNNNFWGADLTGATLTSTTDKDSIRALVLS